MYLFLVINLSCYIGEYCVTINIKKLKDSYKNNNVLHIDTVIILSNYRNTI